MNEKTGINQFMRKEIEKFGVHYDEQQSSNIEIREAKLDEKAKTYYAKGKQLSQDKDLKKNSAEYGKGFINGLKNMETIPVLALTFVMMLLLWIPMMYGSMTISLLTGQDGMSNKEMRALDSRLQERYNDMIGE
ncbi:hypothetical protein [Macrococcoides caseolyticum]|uniref:Uncharacterized protein n=1 Tax=Macrococcus caseolyticus (strain JCSC5402) TaxID=458233 RepID=B9EC98_MACCJ|nr:hypothetical protein [Macrococcus caseolyticus]BAH18706.1 hypothetical protein MCCL_plsB0028 [Macrococcus caseolyticus JCSC5402]